MVYIMLTLSKGLGNEMLTTRDDIGSLPFLFLLLDGAGADGGVEAAGFGDEAAEAVAPGIRRADPVPRGDGGGGAFLTRAMNPGGGGRGCFFVAASAATASASSASIALLLYMCVPSSTAASREEATGDAALVATVCCATGERRMKGGRTGFMAAAAPIPVTATLPAVAEGPGRTRPAGSIGGEGGGGEGPPAAIGCLGCFGDGT